MPPRISGDTILIDHYVRIDSSLVLTNRGYLRLDDSGAICGHHHLTVQTGARLDIYGLLELDYLWVPGGYTYAGLSGNIVLQHQAQWSNNGAGSSQGAQWIVGPWFDCLAVIHGHPFVGVEDPSAALGPAVWRKADLLYVRIPGGTHAAVLRVWDGGGRELLRRSIAGAEETILLPGGLPEGILYWRIIHDGGSAGGSL